MKPAKFRTKQTKSGLEGSVYHLQDNYFDFDEFESFNNLYGITKKLGFKTAQEAWGANPLVIITVDPNDFEIYLEE